jgi:hypothetical protein
MTMGDPLWSDVVSRIKFDASSFDNTGRVWTTTGAPIYGNNGKFDGDVQLPVGAYLTSTDHGIGLEDFTVEFWFKPPATATQNMFYFSNGLGVYCAVDGGTQKLLVWDINRNLLRHSSSISTTEFTHVAFVKSGSSYHLYANGTPAAVLNTSVIRDLTGTSLLIGKYPLSTATTTGVFLDDFRITKGVARYTGAFTPPFESLPDFGVAQLQVNLISQTELTTDLVKPTAATGLASNLFNVSTANLNLEVPKYLGVVLSNTSTVTANVSNPTSFQALLASESNVSGSIIVPVTLQAVLSNVSSTTVDLAEGKFPALFAASLASNSILLPTLTVPKFLDAAMYSVSQAFSNLRTTSVVAPGWDTSVDLFTEESEIKEIALTFDQLGRPLVFYRIGNDQLYLYWFNAKTSQNESKYIGVGKNPVAGFDIVDDTSDASSDAMLFYVRNDTAFMRIQREDYDVEYNTGVTLPELRLSSSGMRVDNRFQVIYGYSGPKQSVVSPSNPGGTPPGGDPDPGIDPNDPGLPGIQPPIDAKFAYTNGGMHTGSVLVANTVKVNGNDNFNLGFEIVSHGSGHKMGDIYGFYVFGADTWDGFSRNLYGMAYISHQYNYVRFMVWRSSSSLTYTFQMKNTTSLVGKWRFEFVGTTAHMYFNDELKATDIYTSTGPFDGSGRLTFGGVRHVFQGDNNKVGDIISSTISFDGALRNCWIDHPNYGRLDWAIDNFNDPIQPSVPAGHDLKIMNHKSSNWILVPE